MVRLANYSSWVRKDARLTSFQISKLTSGRPRAYYCRSLLVTHAQGWTIAEWTLVVATRVGVYSESTLIDRRFLRDLRKTILRDGLLPQLESPCIPPACGAGRANRVDCPTNF